MEWVEFIPDNDLLRFLGKSIFKTIQMYNGGIGSRVNKDLYIEGNNSPVSLYMCCCVWIRGKICLFVCLFDGV